jgi:VWFA-related protein
MILFDLVNTPQLDQLYARRQLLKFLRELPQGQQIALFLLSDRLHMLQSFTASSDRLIAAATAVAPKDFHLIRSPEQTMADADLLTNLAKALGRDPGGIIGHMKADEAADNARAADRRARITLQAFADLARAVSGYPGRKNLLWLSEDFPLMPTAELQINDLSLDARFAMADLPGERETANLIASAQIAVYPISVAGLDTAGIGVDVNGSGEVSGGGGQMNITMQNQFAVRQQMRNTLDDLARQTGGEAFYGNNDFAGALRRSLDAGSNYYSLAYRPSNQRWDGQFRKIRVDLAHKGNSLTYRRGYFATPDSSPPVDAVQQLDVALQPETPQFTMLLLRSEIPEMHQPQQGVLLDCNVDAGNIAFTETPDGHRHAQLLVKLVAFNDSAIQPTAALQSAGMLNVDFDPAHYKLVQKAGIAFRPQLALSPGRYRLRLGVADMTNHRIGTLDIPFTLEEKAASHP